MRARLFKLLMPTLVVALLLSGALPLMADSGKALGRYIVVIKPGVDASAVARGHGAAVSHVYAHALNGFAAPLSPAQLRGLATDPRVAYVEPDLVVHTCEQTVPTGVDRIDADLNATANINGVDERVDVDIAVIDTGIDGDHPDLNVYTGYNFTRGPSHKWDDGYGHGTHVAGSAAALDNGIGVVGVAPGARLWAVRVLGNDGSGWLSDVIAGIDWVTQNAGQIEVANMSLGWQGNVPSARQAIQNSVAAGVVYVVAAGNDAQDVYGSDGTLGTSDDFEPASYPEVATISAMADSDGQPGDQGEPTWAGNDDTFASFSNFSGSEVAGNPVESPGAAIDLLMPGVDIYSTYKGGAYATMSGTSMSSPHGAGLAALYIAVNGRATDATGVHAIRQALINGGVAQDSLQGLATLDDPDSNWENIGWAGPPGPVDNPPTVDITNPADGSMVSGTTVAVTADASDDNGVEQVEFFVDTVSIGVDTSDPYGVAWDTTKVGDGTHTVTATATDTTGQPATDSAITSPVNGATVSGTIDVTADATDDKGVTQVEFFVDGVSIYVDTIGDDGWSFPWDTTTVDGGPYTISATATDTIGQPATDSISVTVDNTQPTVSITSPTEGAPVSGTIDVTADASDTTSGVTQVEFFVDGASIGVDTNGADGWSVTWDTSTATNGSHTLTATATDAAGNLATSDSVTVTVDNLVATTMHVGDLDGSKDLKGKSGRWEVFVTVTIHDENDGPVAGATVTGEWGGATIGTVSGTTGSDGTITFSTGNMSGGTEVTFTVTGVTHDILTYDATANHDPDGDSDGTSITVTK